MRHRIPHSSSITRGLHRIRLSEMMMGVCTAFLFFFGVFVADGETAFTETKAFFEGVDEGFVICLALDFFVGKAFCFQSETGVETNLRRDRF